MLFEQEVMGEVVFGREEPTINVIILPLIIVLVVILSDHLKHVETWLRNITADITWRHNCRDVT